MWPELVQDGYCNDESNNPDCNFDGDDCCYACVDKEHCQDCLCIHEHGWQGINPLIGDGFCQDGMNSAQCNFDQGDCCLFNITINQCTNCTCLVHETCAAGYHPLVGDGFCHDISNNERVILMEETAVDHAL